MKKSVSFIKLWIGLLVEFCLEDESYKKFIEDWKIIFKFLVVFRRIVVFLYIGFRIVFWFWIKII